MKKLSIIVENVVGFINLSSYYIRYLFLPLIYISEAISEHELQTDLIAGDDCPG